MLNKTFMEAIGAVFILSSLVAVLFTCRAPTEYKTTWCLKDRSECSDENGKYFRSQESCEEFIKKRNSLQDTKLYYCYKTDY